MQFPDLIGKKVALLLLNVDKEDDAHVYLGQITMEAADYTFSNHAEGWRVTLSLDQMTRLTKVTDNMSEIFLGADYFIPMYVGDLPDDPGDDLIKTGLKWH